MNGSELPFGISDFPMLSGYYYADKSFLIEEIVSSHLGKTILLTRPLHYGKTLNLSMLEHFFSIDRKDSSPLFDNLSISDNAALRKKHQNAHPVIRLDLGGEDFEEAIASSFHLEKRPIDELAPLCKERIHALVEGTGEKAILLVDDYDHPIQLTYLYGKYEELII